ncbi:NAD(+)--rifampin ADP-ribosyltransferase [Pseudarthrobacter sp. MDT3-26]|uniref:NAD(+)--rifampin ADP-ribosyltransferase n=1 Tax=Pseudarthrobacter raffinosi TaxID=2953651 RepID=UPI00208E354C|nr:NAD(+)--rifampin ADP-ribosyltransferase [Pseudarthrobacter sp. MDT3-26]MCO4264507.1 NAD(+)--rifampin ADP-ribosyltransferase [Pseudarthrobacter sp. MDT3-26]
MTHTQRALSGGRARVKAHFEEAIHVEIRGAEDGELYLPDRHVGCGYLGAELGVGEGPGRIYRVEPTGPFEDDPNLTDKKFPGNPTRSYRTQEPLRVVDEILDWQPHSPPVASEQAEPP